MVPDLFFLFFSDVSAGRGGSTHLDSNLPRRVQNQMPKLVLQDVSMGMGPSIYTLSGRI